MGEILRLRLLLLLATLPAGATGFLFEGGFEAEGTLFLASGGGGGPGAEGIDDDGCGGVCACDWERRAFRAATALSMCCEVKAAMNERERGQGEGEGGTRLGSPLRYRNAGSFKLTFVIALS